MRSLGPGFAPQGRQCVASYEFHKVKGDLSWSFSWYRRESCSSSAGSDVTRGAVHGMARIALGILSSSLAGASDEALIDRLGIAADLEATANPSPLAAGWAGVAPGVWLRCRRTAPRWC